MAVLWLHPTGGAGLGRCGRGAGVDAALEKEIVLQGGEVFRPVGDGQGLNQHLVSRKGHLWRETIAKVTGYINCISLRKIQELTNFILHLSRALHLERIVHQIFDLLCQFVHFSTH